MVRRAAVFNLTDQALLAKIAVEDKSDGVRMTALEKLDNQAVLAEIAIEDHYSLIKEAAVRRLSNEILLSKIAETQEGIIGQIAAEKLKELQMSR